jgi:hypothetical protein
MKEVRALTVIQTLLHTSFNIQFLDCSYMVATLTNASRLVEQLSDEGTQSSDCSNVYFTLLKLRISLTFVHTGEE